MSRDLAPAPATAPAAAPFGSIQSVDAAKLEQTIEQMYFQGKQVKPEQKAIFRHAVARTGLDPIIGQIRPVLRQDQKTKEWAMAIQTSIDGYRLIAARTGEHAGTDDALYPASAQEEFQEKQWYDTENSGRASRLVKKTFEHPVVASVTVYRLVNGSPRAFTASARWAEYYPGPGNQGFMWRKMPYLMLGKCAEALALRKGFPAELSGIYTDDEMQQARDEDPKEKTDVIDAQTVEQKAAAKEKMPPTVTQVMESMNEFVVAGDKAKFQQAYLGAWVFPWNEADAQTMGECYINGICRLNEWMTNGSRTQFIDTTGNFVAYVTKMPTGQLKITRMEKQEKPAEPKQVPGTGGVSSDGVGIVTVVDEQEKAMAEAEARGKEIDSAPQP